MKSFLPVLGISLLISSCDLGDPILNGMRDPEPVIVDVPQDINHPLVIDTAYYVFHILKDEIVLEHAAKKIKVGNMNQFDSFVKENKSAMDSTRVALQVDSVAYKRVDSAIQIFKDNAIFQFNLITDLEKDTGVK